MPSMVGDQQFLKTYPISFYSYRDHHMKLPCEYHRHMYDAE